MTEILRDNLRMQRREAWCEDGWVACVDHETLDSLSQEKKAALRYGQGRAYLVSRWHPEKPLGYFPAPPSI